MQLFSRNKAIVALSLGALALGACGDDVTVPVAPTAPITLSITPPSANMNVGEAVNFAVQISGGATTGGPTLASCTTSSATVATAVVAGSSCRVTAVAAGNATITATASTGQSAAASVSVTAPAPAITSLAVSPTAAQLAIGQTVSLVPTVQPSGRTSTFAYVSSSATIASVSTAGVVTAVAPGVATITVTATGSGAGFSTATIAQAVTITVSDRAPGLTSLTVQPASVALALGATQALTQTVQGPRAASVTYTYLSSAPAVATVSNTGVVTAVSAGTAVIGVTASSTEAGAFAASAITALVPVTVAPSAQVAIINITNGGGALDISNVADQIEIDVQVTPNGQNVSQVNLYVCVQGEPQATCFARNGGEPAARQAFSASGSPTATVKLFVNTSEFTPDFTTGADNVRFKNGLRTIVATLTTSPAPASTVASNIISSLNFNNPDGWTIEWAQPANRANDATGRTWYGGPTVADAFMPNAPSGRSTFTIIPVVYTPDRSVVRATLNIEGLVCGRNAQGNIDPAFEAIELYGSAPYRGSFGVQSRDTLTGAFNCAGAVSAGTETDLVVPTITGIDNRNQTYGNLAFGARNTQQQIYDDFGTLGGFAPNSRYRQSLAFRRNVVFIPVDYSSPNVLGYDVRGGGSVATGGAWIDSAWVNGTYAFAGSFARIDTTIAGRNLRAGDPTRLAVQDGGVGLLGGGPTTSLRNTRFLVCNTPSTIPVVADTVATACTAPIVTATIAGTVAAPAAGQPALGQSANLSNSAYFVQIVETDRLGNRGNSQPFAFTARRPDNTQVPVAATPAFNEPAPGTTGNRTSPQAFGVDLIGPELLTIPNPAADETALQPSVAGVRSGIDSIFSTLHNTYAQPTTQVNARDVSLSANNALFAVRVRDERSGFYNCNNVTGNSNDVTTTSNSCSLASPTSEVNMGTFQIRRQTPQLNPLASNDALDQDLVQNTNPAENNATFGRFSTVMNGVSIIDPSIRQFTISIASQAPRALPSTQPAVTVARDGYYTFSAIVQDRAGNTTTVPARRVAIDNGPATLNNLVLPALFTGGQRTPVTLQASDNLEVMGTEMSLGFPVAGAPVALASGLNIRFNRVNNFTTPAGIRTGLFQNPFVATQAVRPTPGKLATPTGAGQFFGGNVAFPIPFIQDLQVAAGGVVAAIPAQPYKPATLAATVYDIRSMMTVSGNFTAPTTSGAFNIGSTTGGFSTRTENIAFNQVSAGTFVKNWGNDVGVGPTFNQGAGIDRWELVSSTATTAEWRARAISSIVNPPFQQAAIITRRLTSAALLTYDANYEFRELVTLQRTVNEGGQRFFVYTWTAGAAVPQGGGASQFAFANGDSVRACGIDANGNALCSDAALPGTVAPVNVITGVTVNSVHIGSAAIPVNPTIDNLNLLRTRNTSGATANETPVNVAGDARIFAPVIGRARIWFNLTQPAGAPIASVANGTVLTCTSSTPSITIDQFGFGNQIAAVGAATVNRAFCDVRGTADGQSVITLTAAQPASAPYSASTAVNTIGTVTVFSGPVAATFAPAGAATSGLVGANFVTNIPFTTTFTFPATVDNSTVLANTFLPAAANIRTTGITFGQVVNLLNGNITVTVTCAPNWSLANSAGVVFANATTPPGSEFVIITQLRAVTNSGYSNPTQFVPANVRCN